MREFSIPKMATIEETAAMFGVSSYFVRRLVRGGKVIAVKTGRKYLVNVDRFDDYLNSHTLGANEPQETTSGIKPISVNL